MNANEITADGVHESLLSGLNLLIGGKPLQACDRLVLAEGFIGFLGKGFLPFSKASCYVLERNMYSFEKELSAFPEEVSDFAGRTVERVMLSALFYHVAEKVLEPGAEIEVAKGFVSLVKTVLGPSFADACSTMDTDLRNLGQFPSSIFSFTGRLKSVFEGMPSISLHFEVVGICPSV